MPRTIGIPKGQHEAAANAVASALGAPGGGVRVRDTSGFIRAQMGPLFDPGFDA